MNKQDRNKIIYLLFFFFLLPLFGALVLSIPSFYDQKIPPKTFAANISLEYLTAKEAENLLSKIINDFLEKPADFYFLNKKSTLIPNKIGIQVNIKSVIKDIPLIDKNNYQYFFQTNLKEKKIMLRPEINLAKLESNLRRKIAPLRKGRNAQFVFEKGKGLTIIPGSKVYRIDYSRLMEDLTMKINNLSAERIILKGSLVDPLITEELLTQQKAILEQKINSSVRLLYANKKWDLKASDFNLLLLSQSSLDLHKINSSLSKYNLPLKFKSTDSLFFPVTPNFPLAHVVTLKPPKEEIISFIQKNINPEINISDQGVKISRDKENRIIFEGVAQDGKQIEEEKLAKMIGLALNQNINQINIPILNTKAKIETADEFSKLGIKNLIATGFTSFAGSTLSRIHNIKIGMSRYDGLLIAPGEEFSFDKYLGPVDAKAGYKKELVIKKKKTEPDYGGGLCQVSSTMYRAVFFGGLPITQKKPHSYAVSYYAYPLGYGLDATIYPPTEDLKFINDTGAHILIQSYADGVKAYIKFYGTDDGRVVKTEGPYISNKKSAPAESIIEYTSDLPPGEKKQMERALAGFDALWYRTIINKDGQEKKEEWLSKYQAWPARFMAGEEKKPEEGKN